MLRSLDFVQKEICGHWGRGSVGSDLVSCPIAYPNPSPALEPEEKVRRPRCSQTHSSCREQSPGTVVVAGVRTDKSPGVGGVPGKELAGSVSTWAFV